MNRKLRSCTSWIRRAALLVIPWILLGFNGCTSWTAKQDNPLISDSQTPKQDPKTDPMYESTEIFDRFVRNQLSASELQTLKTQCRAKSPSNIYCFSVRREKDLRNLERRRAHIPKVHVKEVLARAPKVVGGKIQGYEANRKTAMKSLLKGMEDYSVSDLKLLAARSLRDKRCPQNIGVAASAILEGHLPEPSLIPTIGQLYERGANCARRKSKDKDHFATRAGLFFMLARDYAHAEKVLTDIRPSDAYSGRSVFWLHRARLAQNDLPGARQALTRLQSSYPFSFHALVAHAAEAVDPLILKTPSAEGPKTRSRKKNANSVIEQAEHLWRLGFSETAALVSAWCLTRFRPPENEVQLYVASLGAADTQVRTATQILLTRPALRTEPHFLLAYPRAYFDVLRSEADGVDPYLLLAIARKESQLSPIAVSPANAQGLLQLNPETAKRFASDESLNLFDPRTNAKISARYLKELFTMMKGQLPLVVAAYNAGEQAVLTWVNRYPTEDALLFIDLIPYRETRDYVGYVMANYYWYRRLYEDNADQPLVSLTSTTLARVEPPRGMRTVQSIVSEALESSEEAEESATPPHEILLDTWKQN